MMCDKHSVSCGNFFLRWKYSVCPLSYPSLSSGIPANISAEQLKSTLESNFNIGKVSVSGFGTCASYSWTIEWATTGGDQPALVVDGNGLTGNNVSIKAVTIDDGGLFLRPIPGDMLRVAERKPQVSTSSKQERNQNPKKLATSI